MQKSIAIEIFGSLSALAEALSTTRQTIYNWPDTLEQHQVDRVIGAAIRHGKLPGLIEQGLQAQRRETA